MQQRSNGFATMAAMALGIYAATRMAARRARKIYFAGKVVVITGGSRGLGLLLARRFGAEEPGWSFAAAMTKSSDARRKS